MKRSNQETDQLTRALMQETIEKPSSDLNRRIMAFLLRKAPQKAAFSVKKPVSARQLLLLFTVYILGIAGGLLLLQKQGGNLSELMLLLKEIFPIFLTVAGGVSFFILFGLLDEWLQQRGYKLPKE